MPTEQHHGIPLRPGRRASLVVGAMLTAATLTAWLALPATASATDSVSTSVDCSANDLSSAVSTALGTTATLDLASGCTYSLPAPADGYLLPEVTAGTDLTVEGDGATVTTVTGTSGYGLFGVDAGATLELDDLTVTGIADGTAIYNAGGTVTLNSSTISDGSGDNGGAVLNGDGYTTDGTAVQGTMTVDDSTFDDDTASASAGAIDNDAGSLTVDDSTFNGDTAGTVGGAIYDTAGIAIAGEAGTDSPPETPGSTLTISGSTFDDDSSTSTANQQGGGAIAVESEGNTNESAAMTISATTFGDDTALEGGAILDSVQAGSETLSVTGSTFTGDQANDVASNGVGGDGGAIDLAITSSYPDIDTATVAQSTFSDNAATYDGGAIDTGDQLPANGDAGLTVSSSSFTGNSAGSDGGAIDNGDALQPVGDGSSPGTATTDVTTSSFTGNSAGDGGAIDNGDGDAASSSTASLSVASSSFVGNSAYDGGAVDNGDFYDWEGDGTGPATSPGAMAVVTGSSVSGGAAPSSTYPLDGAAFDNGDNADPAGGSDAVLGLAGDLLADGGSSAECDDGASGAAPATVSDGGYNLADDTSCLTTGTAGDTVDADLASEVTTSDGVVAPTGAAVDEAAGMIDDPTTVSLAGSSVALCPRSDQDGTQAPLPGASGCSIGAVEVSASPTGPPTAPEGSGTVTGSPTTVPAGSAGNTLTFTYTAATGGTDDGSVSLTVPAGWSTPSTTGTDPGFTTATGGSGTDTVTTSGDTATVSGVTLPAGGTLTVTYGDTSQGGPGATAGATGQDTFAASEASTATGTLTSLSASPAVIVGPAAPAGSTAAASGSSGTPATIGTGSATTEVSASGGTGAFTLAQYAGLPSGTATPPFESAGEYFDVAASSGNTLSDLTITDCNLNGGDGLEWWNGTTWAQVTPTSGPTGTPPCLTATLSATSSPTISQLTGTVFAVAKGAPQLSGPTTVTATVGKAFSVTLSAGGSPTPTLTEKGALPAGLRFSTRDGQAVISGVPEPGTGGSYQVTISAANRAGTTGQTLTLTVDEAPGFRSPLPLVLGAVHYQLSVTVTTVGYPAPAVTESGTLPPGISFTPDGSSATIAGVPTRAGVWLIRLVASNDVGQPTVELVAITVL